MIIIQHIILCKRKIKGGPIKEDEFYKEIWISQDLRQASSNVHQPGFLETELYDKILRLVDEFWTAHRTNE